MTPTFCVLPFNSVCVAPFGSLRICCHNYEIPKNEEGRELSFADPEFELLGAVNSPLHRDIRRSMLNGERHPSCERCWGIEDRGGTSFRQIWNHHFVEHTPSYLKDVDAQGRQARVRSDYLELSLGNKCNLRCRSCSPFASSQWVGEARKLKLLPESVLAPLEDSSWLGSVKFREAVEVLVSGARRLNILGGEPLFIEEHYQILRRAVELGTAPGIELQYNSNLTKVAPELLDLWKHFKEVTLSISVDGVGAANEYLRHPLKWESFARNVELVKSWRSQAPLRLWFHSVVQALNLQELPSLLTWVFEQGVPDARIARSTWVSHPSYLDPRVLPRAAREQAWARNRECLDRLEQQSLTPPEEEALATLRSHVENFLNDWPEERRRQEFRQLVDVTEALDRLRGEDVRVHIPEWQSWRETA